MLMEKRTIQLIQNIQIIIIIYMRQIVDLILYLLHIMHQELNYYTLNKYFTGYPNQCDRENTLQVFIASYDATNKSIISDLFYGTNENTTKCLGCNRVIYNFQKWILLYH